MQRTFVKFGESEIDFLRTLQKVIHRKTGHRAKLAGVLRGVVRDYRALLERRADPEFLQVYRDVRSGRRAKRL